MEKVSSFAKNEHWTKNRILLCAFAARLTLVLYSHIHDYIFRVNFTDIDYHVFSDAAHHVWNGASPFDRPTYRYTPALAWILLPVVKFPDFGKILFCVFDIIVAWLCFQILEQNADPKMSNTEKQEKEHSQLSNVVLFWLANPLTAVISSRGNAEAIVSAAVLLNILLLQRGYWKSAALVHGGLAIHLKIYPIIYLPSVFLFLSDVDKQKGFAAKFKSLITNWKGYAYGIITIASFGLIVAVFYHFYGDVFLEEFLIYHVKRRDIKHNFSPYFFILYIFNDNEFLSKLIGALAFVPQLVLTVVFAFRHFDDLPFCWFVTTFAFVAFNKVCTSQYFVWYIVLLPLIADKIKMSMKRAVVLVSAWLISQGLWLLFAYLFEFRGWDTFVHMFFASCLFLIVNSVILFEIRRHYVSSPKLEKLKSQ